jgi:hypothetical protein
LGESQEEAENHACQLVNILTSVGIRVNVPKSMGAAAQVVDYLGQVLDLQDHLVKPQASKEKIVLNMAKHLVKGATCTPRHLAGLAGSLLDAVKSNVGLEGLPQQLLKVNSKLVRAQAQSLGLSPHHQRCWGLSQPKNPEVDRCLRMIRDALLTPVHRVLRPSTSHKFTLQTDSSGHGWGAVLIQQDTTLSRYSGFWTKQEARRHITWLEAKASALALGQALDLLPQGCELKLQVDAISTRHAWAKGSKLPHLNDLVVGPKVAAHQKRIFLAPEYLPGVLNTQADWLSRHQERLDPDNYRLHRSWFHRICRLFRYTPTVDLFASQLNHQLPRYGSWKSDHRSLGNAFGLDWSQELAWANPPWALAQRMLKKVQDDRATALVALPVWRTAPWWPLLQTLQVGTPVIIRGESLFCDPQNNPLPAPRWATIFTMVRG